jgi:hypothetical protein
VAREKSDRSKAQPVVNEMKVWKVSDKTKCSFDDSFLAKSQSRNIWDDNETILVRSRGGLALQGLFGSRVV